MYYKWQFTIKDEFMVENSKFIYAYYSDAEIEDMKLRYPEVKWHD